MADLVRVIDGQTIWPYSLSRLRFDEPSRSFSNNPSDRELAHYGCFRVRPTQSPSPDPAQEKVIEVMPIEADGAWVQQWQLVELSEAEKLAYYQATHPPRWLEFGAAVTAMAEINMLLGQALQAAPALAMALPVGLGKAADGDARVFLGAWQSARGAGLVNAELVSGLQMLATQYDLPADFVSGLAEVQQ